MSDVADALVRSVILLAFVFGVTALGLVLVRKWRDRASRADGTSSEIMANFRDLHDRGGLSDEEFRTIKAKLASSVKAELNRDGRESHAG